MKKAEVQWLQRDDALMNITCKFRSVQVQVCRCTKQKYVVSSELQSFMRYATPSGPAVPHPGSF